MLAASVCGFALGIGLALWFGAPWFAGWGLAMGVGAIAALLARRLPDPRPCLFAALVLPGALWQLHLAPHPGPLDVSRLAPRRFLRLTGVVATPPARTDDGWRARLYVSAPSCGWVDATWPAPGRPGVGTSWTLAGRLVLPEGPRNPGEPDRRARLARQRVFALFRAETATPIGPAPGWWGARVLDGLRVRLIDGLACGLPAERAALLGSLVLGTGASPVDPVLAEHFRDVGLSHLLAASGAQVGMLSAVLYAGAVAVGLSSAWAAGLTFPALLVYLALTGAPASMVRATWMGAVALFGLGLERRAAPFVALWVAAGVMLAWDPGTLADLGFQFSFLATYALCRLAERGGGKPAGLKGWAIASLRISWAANLWCLPLQLFTFQQSSFLSLPANLLTEPLVLALTPWGVGVAVLGAICPPIAHLVAPLTNVLLATLEFLVNGLAAIPGGSFYCPALPVAVVVFAYAAIWCGREHPRWFAACAAATTLAACAPTLHPPRLELAVLSVGQGDGIVIHTPDDRWAVIDAGPAFRGQDAGEQVLVPYLHRMGCRRLDLVVATHAHLDHIGGLPALAHAFPIAHAWDPGQLDPGHPYHELLSTWLSAQIPWNVADQGNAWTSGGATLEVLSHPNPHAPLNDGSIVTRLTFGHFHAVLMGDTEAAGEARLLAAHIPLAADVLKVGHHGSHTSSTAPLLAAIHPKLAIISVGRNNRFGHPDADVVQRLSAFGAKVARTDNDGAVLVRSDGVNTGACTGRDGWSAWSLIR